MIRLCYPRGSDNVGDELNAWLWPALLGDTRSDTDIELLGIGTPLNEPFCRHLHAELSIAVLSAGTGYGAPPQLDRHMIVYALRRARTFAALELL